MRLSVDRNSSVLLFKARWNEPFWGNQPNALDYYLLTVNQVLHNVTRPTVDVMLPPNETDLTITVRASNCFGLTPTMTYILNLTNGIRGLVLL